MRSATDSTTVQIDAGSTSLPSLLGSRKHRVRGTGGATGPLCLHHHLQVYGAPCKLGNEDLRFGAAELLINAAGVFTPAVALQIIPLAVFPRLVAWSWSGRPLPTIRVEWVRPPAVSHVTTQVLLASLELRQTCQSPKVAGHKVGWGVKGGGHLETSLISRKAGDVGEGGHVTKFVSGTIT